MCRSFHSKNMKVRMGRVILPPFPDEVLYYLVNTTQIY